MARIFTNASSKLTSCILRSCCFGGLCRRMRAAIRFDGPTGQKQPQNDTQNHLFLPGQAMHARQCSGKWASSQWESGQPNRRGPMRESLMLGQSADFSRLNAYQNHGPGRLSIPPHKCELSRLKSALRQGLANAFLRQALRGVGLGFLKASNTTTSGHYHCPRRPGRCHSSRPLHNTESRHRCCLARTIFIDFSAHCGEIRPLRKCNLR